MTGQQEKGHALEHAMSATQNTAAGDGQDRDVQTGRAAWRRPVLRPVPSASAQIGPNIHTDGEFTQS